MTMNDYTDYTRSGDSGWDSMKKKRNYSFTSILLYIRKEMNE